MNRNAEPSIFSYVDYRAYLRDLYAWKKSRSSLFSHRVFVRKCGFKSPNFLKLVMDGKRSLGAKAGKKVIEAFCKTKREKEYLEALLAFDRAKPGTEKIERLEEIRRLQHRTKVRHIATDQYEYLSKWQMVALREMVCLDDFRENADWINRKLGTRLSDRTISGALDMLQSLALLKRGKNDRLEQADANVVSDPDVFSTAVIQYHRQMIAKAAESIDATDSRNRDISGLTFCTDRKTFEAIRKKIQEFREDIHALASSAETTDAVYQLNLQLFNLTEVVWKSECENN